MTNQPNTPRLGEELSDGRPETCRRNLRIRGTAITAGVLLLVILFNVLFSILADRFMWQIDETVTRDYPSNHLSLYTPSEDYLDWVAEKVIPMIDQCNEERAKNGQEPLTLNVKFCADRDRIYASDEMRLLQYSVASLQKKFPDHITVSYINIEENPSAVQRYKATSASRIYPHQLIFEFGSEYRLRSYDSFFVKSEATDTSYTYYDGEQQIASLLSALTYADSPIAAFITNHGEKTAQLTSFRTLVERSGYDVVDIDLSRDAIPENCRLLICYDPQTDFMGIGNSAYTGTFADESEIDKLDAFLDNSYSFMLFVDQDTPRLPVLEDYMEEWGVTIARGELADGTVENYTVRDTIQKMDKDGYTVIADYAAKGSVGGTLTAAMQNVASPAKVIFPNATAIKLPHAYAVTLEAENTSTGAPAYTYGKYYSNGIARYSHDVFRGSVNTVAEVGGEQYEISTELDRLRLMTLSSEPREDMDSSYRTSSDPSYVVAFGSTEFVSNTILESAAYGNADVISATLNVMGREAEHANVAFKRFKIYTVDAEYYTANPKTMTATTIVLTLAPILACITVGAVVSIKRKYR